MTRDDALHDGPDHEKRARAFALAAHGAQKYGDAPYVVHLEAVRAVLRDFGHDGPLGVAAWLHDTIEDTAATRADVAREFGPEVAELVWAVTGEGENRKARNEAAYAKMRAIPLAVTLKLADRIANVEASASRPDKLEMYRAEFESFRAALEGLGEPAMWERLARALQ